MKGVHNGSGERSTFSEQDKHISGRHHKTLVGGSRRTGCYGLEKKKN